MSEQSSDTCLFILSYLNFLPNNWRASWYLLNVFYLVKGFKWNEIKSKIRVKHKLKLKLRKLKLLSFFRSSLMMILYNFIETKNIYIKYSSILNWQKYMKWLLLVEAIIVKYSTFISIFSFRNFKNKHKPRKIFLFDFILSFFKNLFAYYPPFELIPH